VGYREDLPVLLHGVAFVINNAIFPKSLFPANYKIHNIFTNGLGKALHWAFPSMMHAPHLLMNS
jgi:hypothetical protein